MSESESESESERVDVRVHVSGDESDGAVNANVCLHAFMHMDVHAYSYVSMSIFFYAC